MFSHLCQHCPNRVPKRVPAHADDANLCKRGLDLLFENGAKVQRLLPFVATGRENKIPGPLYSLCDFHSSNAGMYSGDG
jgi:hypothetical protein